MDLYRGTISEKQPDGVFSHFGTLLAACHRIESLFSGQALRMFTGEDLRYLHTKKSQSS
jgi:uncharacterized membrane protein